MKFKNYKIYLNCAFFFCKKKRINRLQEEIDKLKLETNKHKTT